MTIRSFFFFSFLGRAEAEVRRTDLEKGGEAEYRFDSGAALAGPMLCWCCCL